MFDVAVLSLLLGSVTVVPVLVCHVGRHALLLHGAILHAFASRFPLCRAVCSFIVLCHLKRSAAHGSEVPPAPTPGSAAAYTPEDKMSLFVAEWTAAAGGSVRLPNVAMY